MSENPSAPTLSRVFYSKLVSRCYQLVNISSGTERNFLEAYLGRFLVEDMKRVLRAKKSGGDLERTSLIEIPQVGRAFHVDLKAMSEASSVQDAMDSLKESRFKKVLLLMPTYQKYGIISLIEAFLDKAYYDLEILPALDLLKDKKQMIDMVAVELDLTIIKILIDLKVRGVAADALKGLGLKALKVKNDEINVISEANQDSIPEALSRTSYADLAQLFHDALDPSKEESMDYILRSEILKRSKVLMIRHSDTLAYPLGYLRQAEAEANNLVTIVTGKELGLAETKIESALCY